MFRGKCWEGRTAINIENVKKALGENYFNKLEKVEVKKGKEFFLTEAHFILEGTIELFVMDYENTGEYIKVANIDNNYCFMGFHSYLKEEYFKEFHKGNFDIFYRAKTDAILIRVPSMKVDELFDNNISFLKLAMKTFYDRMIKINSLFLFRATSPKVDVVRNILEKELESSDEIELHNIVDLVDSHKINRSTFYKSINTLEESGVIKKEKKVITFVNRSSE